MTKTLTEQWREGTLESGMYYWKLPNNETFMATLYKMDEYKQTKDASKIICLAPVPSYEEYKELLHHSELSRNLVNEVLVNQKEYNELLDKAKENKRLQEQLKEVNEIIISVAAMPRFPVNPELCREYLEKWGVK